MLHFLKFLQTLSSVNNSHYVLEYCMLKAERILAAGNSRGNFFETSSVIENPL